VTSQGPPGASCSGTVVAVTFPGGVIMAGDRRMTTGGAIAHRRAEKVFQADEHSCVGVASTAGPAMEMVRRFQVELEHAEKVEARPLSFEGKVHRLTACVRGGGGAPRGTTASGDMPLAPLFAGYDEARETGRIVRLDATGGTYERPDHDAVGSGAVFARAALKKLYRPDLSTRDAVHAGIHALCDAADDDPATGGPDPARGISPLVAVVTSDGVRRLAETEAGAHAMAVVDARANLEGGQRSQLS
jgi:proteasome beta subunit